MDDRPIMHTSPQLPTLEPFLRSLDEEKLKYFLEEVLTECRRRESEQIKRDILTHSQSLRLKRVSGEFKPR